MTMRKKMAVYETIPEQIEAFNLIVPPEVQHLVFVRDHRGKFLPMNSGDRIALRKSGDIEIIGGHEFKHTYRLATALL
jgi:hypothetical protein